MNTFDRTKNIELVKVTEKETPMCTGYIDIFPVVGGGCRIHVTKGWMTYYRTSTILEVEETDKYVLFKTINSLYIIRRI